MNINLLSPINQLGYGVVGLNILKELSKEHNVALFPLGSIDSNEDFVRKALENSNNYDKNGVSLRIWHQFDMAQHVGKLHCGFPIFELNKFSEREKHHLKQLDKIFVSSSWAKKIIEENNIEVETFVAPFGVDREIFKEREFVDTEKTIFLNVGKWEKRKGHDILVEAFNKAFNKEDNVELWVLPNNPFLSENENRTWEQLYKSSKLGNKIKILDRVDTITMLLI
tara:strand:- start:7888 stop:8562 length:675 start_codon:yes stop_codon:yes gene_type:complete